LKIDAFVPALAVLATSSAAFAQAQFGPQHAVAGATLLRALKTIDIDGDGDLDLVGGSSASSTGTLVLIENLDAGTLGTAIPIPAPLGNIRAIAFADVDGDGHLDAIIGDAWNSRVVWCPGNSAGSFGALNFVATVAGPFGIVAEDFDLDGNVDIAVTKEESFVNELIWFAGDGAGTFSAAQLISAALNDPKDLVGADIDNDGDVDLITASRTDDKVAFYRNLGAGSFSAQQIITAGADGAYGLAVGDLDGDGFVDVVCAASDGNQVLWFKNQGGVSFAGRPPLDTAATGTHSVAIGDIDQDGDLDIAAVALGAQGVRWYENVGFGFFTSANLLDGNVASTEGIAIIDVDGDSDGDIVTSQASYNLNITTLVNTYCVSNMNSTGVVAETYATGSTVVSSNHMTLHASGLPSNSFGFFLTSRTQGSVDNPGGSAGRLCLGGAIGRYTGPGQVQFSAGMQAFRLTIDLSETPHPSQGLIAVLPGQTWSFQAWYRDSSMAGPTSNFSSGLALTFH
jgi:hypothetical protein